MQAQIGQHARDQIFQRCNAAPELRSRSAGGWAGSSSATESAAPCARPPDTVRWPTARSTTARGGVRLFCAAQDREPSGTIPCCRPPETKRTSSTASPVACASELLVVPKSMPMAEGCFCRDFTLYYSKPVSASVERLPSARWPERRTLAAFTYCGRPERRVNCNVVGSSAEVPFGAACLFECRWGILTSQKPSGAAAEIKPT